jgi:hypothetical protein
MGKKSKRRNKEEIPCPPSETQTIGCSPPELVKST